MEKCNIVLTGFMGTGKTVTGRILAGRLQMTFIDTDEEVEKTTGLSTPEIFRRYGEGRFRSEESLAIDRVARQAGCVIATGGGAVLNPANMANLRRRGLIILLKADPEAILRRLANCDQRPLLAEVEEQGKLLVHIEGLLKQRALYYEEHDIKFDTSEHRPGEVASEILAWLSSQGWGTGGGPWNT